jgi:dTDP-4-dehydrorhamnose 3,5-epimerase
MDKGEERVMGGFSFEKTSMEGAYLIDSFSACDSRGYFVKDFEKDVFAGNGLDLDFYESFESYSIRDVIRGLHFQTSRPQAKLVRAITGEIFDVIVDLRAGSETFGRWEGFRLTEANRRSIYVPGGFAHGFGVLSDSAIVSYKCVGKYDKESDTGIVWNDRDIDISWGIGNPIVSEKDRGLMSFREFCEKTGGFKQIG